MFPLHSLSHIVNSLSSPVCSDTLKLYISLHPHGYHLTQAIISHLNYCSNPLIGCLASTFVQVQSVLHVTASDQRPHSTQVSQGELGLSNLH